jgi:hypothetical protein
MEKHFPTFATNSPAFKPHGDFRSTIAGIYFLLFGELAHW